MGRQIQRTGGMAQLQKDAAAYGLNADNLTRESSPKESGMMQRQIYRAAEQTAGEIEAFAGRRDIKKPPPTRCRRRGRAIRRPG